MGQIPRLVVLWTQIKDTVSSCQILGDSTNSFCTFKVVLNWHKFKYLNELSKRL